MIVTPSRRLLLACVGVLSFVPQVSAQDVQIQEKRGDIQITPDGDYVVQLKRQAQTAGVPPLKTIATVNSAKVVSSDGAMSGAEFRKKGLDSLKQAMGSSDAEWEVILPRLEKVEQMALKAGKPLNILGSIAVSSAANSSAVATLPVGNAMQSLMKCLQNRSSDAEVKQMVDAYRQARAAALIQLDAARKELGDVLTQRQEAILITRKILE